MDSIPDAVPSDAWIAGFFDGEGNVRIAWYKRGNGQYRNIRASVSQSEPRHHVLYEIQQRYGGKVYDKNEKSHPRHRKGYIWEVFSQREVKTFLEAVLPYLRCKQDEARRAIEAIGEPVDRAGRQKGVKNLIVRTHCRRGHEMTPENSGYRKDTGGRFCRACVKATEAGRNRRYREKKRLEKGQITLGARPPDRPLH